MVASAIYYSKILTYDKLEIINVESKGKYKYINFARNARLVDISDVVYSYYNRKSNGTSNTIKEATRQGKYGGNIYQL